MKEEDIIYYKYLNKEDIVNNIVMWTINILKTKDNNKLIELKEQLDSYEYEIMKYNAIKLNKEYENKNKMSEINENKKMIEKYNEEIKNLDENNKFESEKKIMKDKLQILIDKSEKIKNPSILKNKIDKLDEDLKNINEEINNNRCLLDKRNIKLNYALSIFEDLNNDALKS